MNRPCAAAGVSRAAFRDQQALQWLSEENAKLAPYYIKQARLLYDKAVRQLTGQDKSNADPFIATYDGQHQVLSALDLAPAVLEWVFLGRELPGLRSSAALVITLLGAIAYMVADSHFEVRGYSWAVVWLVIFIFDQVYIKHVVNTVEMTTWSRVYYTNAIAAMPCVVHAIVFENAPFNLVTGFSSPGPVGPCMLIVSAVLGTAMSYFSFFARKVLIATAFTVVGNTCKVVSIIANVFIWDKHASQLDWQR